MRFDIREYITIPHNRNNGNIHIPCPNCQSEDTSNPALSVNLTTGAYHCFKCEGEKNGDIRKALGRERNRIVPTALVAYSGDTTVSLSEVGTNYKTLVTESRLAKKWLYERGFTNQMITHYRLGVKRCKRLDKLWSCISIPIPVDTTGTKFYQKLRIQPWTEGEDRPKELPKWSQKGIPASVWFTWFPPKPQETFLCEGEWDAMMLGYLAKQCNSPIVIATFTCGCETVPNESELERLVGKVTIFYDRNDKPNNKTGERPGDKGALKVAHALGRRGAIALVPQKDEHSDVQGWDVSDAINARFTFDDFVASAAAAIVPPPPTHINQLAARLITNAQLMARAPDYIEWIVPDLLPSDELFILAAGARSGKSLLAMLLAKSVATGEKFLGRAVTQGNVLYVNLEDSEARIKQRQIAQGWSTNVPIHWLDRFKLSECDQLRAIADQMDARLIVLDTFSRIRDDTSNESSAEISKYIEPLQNMAQELKLSVLLVHHTTKITLENAKDISPFDTIRGSGAIRAVCRGSWVLAASERTYRLCVEHGYGERQDLELLLDPDTLSWRSVRPWNPKVNSSQAQQILDHLLIVKSATIPEIASELNLNANYVTTALWRLQTQDLVWKEAGSKNKQGIYHLTDKATESLSISGLNDLSKPLNDMQMIGSQDAHVASIMRELEG